MRWTAGTKSLCSWVSRATAPRTTTEFSLLLSTCHMGPGVSGPGGQGPEVPQTPSGPGRPCLGVGGGRWRPVEAPKHHVQTPVAAPGLSPSDSRALCSPTVSSPGTPLLSPRPCRAQGPGHPASQPQPLRFFRKKDLRQRHGFFSGCKRGSAVDTPPQPLPRPGPTVCCRRRTVGRGFVPPPGVSCPRSAGRRWPPGGTCSSGRCHPSATAPPPAA